VGKVDGKPGINTAAALFAFQTVNEIAADGIFGPETDRALFSDEAKRKPVSMERAATTVQDLRKQGSTEIAAADNIDTTRQVIGGASIAATPWVRAAAGHRDLRLAQARAGVPRRPARSGFVAIVILGLGGMVVPRAPGVPHPRRPRRGRAPWRHRRPAAAQRGSLLHPERGMTTTIKLISCSPP
jgi:hypothetical protein